MDGGRVRGLLPAILFTLYSAAAGTYAQAMPVFAKAYGVQCSTCHTIVPQLNAYGRYVQRTGYSSLNRQVLNTITPFWIGEQLNGDSAGGVSDISPTYTNSLGNLAIHGAGYLLPDFTYHVQQWLLANDDTGGPLDTAWLTYNNLLHRDGHLFIGKVEAPGPSLWSQAQDISPYVPPEMTVGEHAYELDANRWGTKFNYVKGALDVEAGYLLSGNGFLSSADWVPTPGTDKTFQWKVASAHADQPFEVGAYGAAGSYTVSTVQPDHYNAWAVYAQRDPQSHGIPGVFGQVQWNHDSNPGLDANGNQLPGASSNAFSLELFEPLFNQTANLSLRDEYSNDGLGNLFHYQTINFAFNVPGAKYLHGYVEAGMGANSTIPTGGPEWRWLLWWTTPIAQ